MIYLGNNEIKSIHLGNTNIVSGFIGTFPFWGREEPVITINPNFDVYYQQDGENDWQLFDPALISLIDKIGVYNENNECIEIEIPADGKLPYTALTDANRVGFILKTPAEFDVALFKDSDFWEIDGVLTTAPWTRVYNSAEESIVPSGFERLLNLPDTVQRVEDYACAGFVVSLPDGQGGYEQNRLPSACTYIGDYAFSGAGLMQPPDEGAVFDIPSSVTHIGEGAFAFSVMPSVINYNASGGVPANAFQSLTSDINLFSIAEGNTTIGDWAFQGNRIYDITIPEGVTSIGNFAFLGASIIAVDIEGEETYGTGITIPVTVTSLGESVFREGNIPALYFENPVPPTIGSDVFTDCIWTDPETGDEIPTPIYVPCESMDAYKAAWVEWADRITCYSPAPYGYKAVLKLDNGEEVYIPKTSASDNTLYKSEHMAYVSNCIEAEVFEGVTVLSGGALGNLSAMTSCTLPDTITTFGGANIFCDCRKLKRINSNVDGVFNIPSGVSGVWDKGIFARCYDMEALIIPSGVTSIDAMLTEMTGATGHLKYIFAQPLTAPSVVYTTFQYTPSGGTLFHFCDTPTYSTWMQNANNYLGKYGWNSKSVSRTPMMKVTLTNGDDVECYGACNGTITMQENTSRIYSSMTSAIEVYEGVTALGLSAFSGRTSMTSVTLPDSLSAIGQTAFESCHNLESVNFPSGLTTIGYGAFSHCTSLTGGEIPSSVTTVYDRSFQGCSAMTAITIDAVTPPAVKNQTGGTGSLVGIFSGTPIEAIYVPCESVDAYKAANGWSQYADKIVCLNNNKAMLTLSNGTMVEIPKTGDTDTTITSSETSAYTNIVSAKIYDGVTTLDASAFCGKTSMSSVTLPNSVSAIGQTAFQECTNLTGVTFPSGLKDIGYGAFSLCDGLTNVEMPASLTNIGDGAFKQCTALTSVTVDAATPPVVTSTTTPLLGLFEQSPVVEIYVPCAAVDDYKAADGWSTYADQIICQAPEPSNPKQQYFHFISQADGTQIKVPTNLSYSLNAGASWTVGDGSMKTINNGEKIHFKGNNSSVAGAFSGLTTGKAIVQGNSMSLLYGDDFSGKTSLPANGCLQGLLQTSTIVTAANNLILPATTLKESCYHSMFKSCTSLINVPALDATSLATSCYYSMFQNCTNITTAPILRVRTVPLYAYYYMFAGCSKLNYIKAMIMNLKSQITSYWVAGVASSGTFVKNVNAQWTTRGASGAPAGWYVKTASS